MSFTNPDNPEEIDTVIELECYKHTVKLKIVQLVFRYLVLIVALAIGLILALTTAISIEYVVLLVLIIVTYEVSANGSMIKELLERFGVMKGSQ